MSGYEWTASNTINLPELHRRLGRGKKIVEKGRAVTIRLVYIYRLSPIDMWEMYRSTVFAASLALKSHHGKELYILGVLDMEMPATYWKRRRLSILDVVSCCELGCSSRLLVHEANDSGTWREGILYSRVIPCLCAEAHGLTVEACVGVHGEFLALSPMRPDAAHETPKPIPKGMQKILGRNRSMVESLACHLAPGVFLPRLATERFMVSDYPELVVDESMNRMEGTRRVTAAFKLESHKSIATARHLLKDSENCDGIAWKAAAILEDEWYRVRWPFVEDLHGEDWDHYHLDEMCPDCMRTPLKLSDAIVRFLQACQTVFIPPKPGAKLTLNVLAGGSHKGREKECLTPFLENYTPPPMYWYPDDVFEGKPQRTIRLKTLRGKIVEFEAIVSPEPGDEDPRKGEDGDDEPIFWYLIPIQGRQIES